MWNIEKGSNDGMTACLFYHTMACINKNNDQVRIGCTCDHVACVLNMTRCIGDDEFSLWSREIFVGHINGNALFPFGPQSISKQRKVNLTIFAVLSLPFNASN